MIKGLHLNQRIEYKPKPLIGADEVYRRGKEFYCKLETSEFMLLRTDLSEIDVLYDYVKEEIRSFQTPKAKKFKYDVFEALKTSDEDEEIWISTNSASFTENNKIVFIEGAKPTLGPHSYREVEEKIRGFSRENHSQMWSKDTYILILLRALKDNLITIDQILDDASTLGHYRNSLIRSFAPEKTGTREFAGLHDFIGNTSKVVKDSSSRSGYSVADGNCYTVNKSLADFGEVYNSENNLNNLSTRAEIRRKLKCNEESWLRLSIYNK